jgi:hypothetical protein
MCLEFTLPQIATRASPPRTELQCFCARHGQLFRGLFYEMAVVADENDRTAGQFARTNQPAQHGDCPQAPLRAKLITTV